MAAQEMNRACGLSVGHEEKEDELFRASSTTSSSVASELSAMTDCSMETSGTFVCSHDHL